jgi:hypothetical protein
LGGVVDVALDKETKDVGDGVNTTVNRDAELARGKEVSSEAGAIMSKNHQNTQKPAFRQKICGSIPWYFFIFYLVFYIFKVILVISVFFFTTCLFYFTTRINFKIPWVRIPLPQVIYEVPTTEILGSHSHK